MFNVEQQQRINIAGKELSEGQVYAVVNALLQDSENAYLLHGLFADQVADERIKFLETEILSRDMLRVTRNSYNDNSRYYAAKYEYSSDMVKKTWEGYLKAFCAALRKGDSVGVFGCGNGRDVMQLASHGFSVIAMDNSDAMLDAVKAIGNGSISVQKVDVIKATETFKGDNFDSILAESVLEHVNKKDVRNLVLRDFPQLLKYQGRLLFRLKVNESGKVMKSDDGMGARYYSTWNSKEVEKLLEDMRSHYRDINTWLVKHKDEEKPPFLSVFAINNRKG